MKKWILAIIIFLFLSVIVMFFLRLLGYKIGRNCRIGFSWVIVNELEMADYAKIGHLNFIYIPLLHMGQASYIKKCNVIKGSICLIIELKGIVNQFNYMTSAFTHKNSICKIENNAILGVGHTLDLTSDIRLGAYSILAGKGSQVWTHGFYHSKKTHDRWRIDGKVEIGKNVYIGSRAIICAGVHICNNCTIGAGVVVAKDIVKEGLYVNQALRYIEFDPDEAIKKLRKVAEYIYEK